MFETRYGFLKYHDMFFCSYWQFLKALSACYSYLWNMNKYIIVILALVVLSGTGCGKKDATKDGGAASANSASGRSVKVDKVQTEDDLRAELKQALKNFQEAKSFKANVDLTVADNEMKANLFVAKPNRFKGVITTKDVSMEIILVENDMYLKMDEGDWARLAPSADNKKTIDKVKKTINGDDSLENMGVDDSRPITKYRRSDKNCDVYQTELKSASGDFQAVKICVDKELPKLLETRTDDGTLSMEYYDINSVFLIERPTR